MELERLEEKVQHTQRLQERFEELKLTTKATTAALESDLQEVRRDVLRRENRVKELLLQSTAAAHQASEYREASSITYERARVERDQLVAQASELRTRLRRRQESLANGRSELAQGQFLLEQVVHANKRDEAAQGEIACLQKDIADLQCQQAAAHQALARGEAQQVRLVTLNFIKLNYISE